MTVPLSRSSLVRYSRLIRSLYRRRLIFRAVLISSFSLPASDPIALSLPFALSPCRHCPRLVPLVVSFGEERDEARTSDYVGKQVGRVGDAIRIRSCSRPGVVSRLACRLVRRGRGAERFPIVVRAIMGQASNEAMASIPSRSISSRLIISSHPPHETSRPSSRPMRLANHLERIPPPGHQRGKSDDEASKRTRKNRKAGTRNEEQDGAKTERTQQDNGEKRSENGRQASKQRKDDEDIRRNHAQEQRPSSFSPDPLAVGSRRAIGLNQFPRPQGVG